jgi:beta-glucosidase
VLFRSPEALQDRALARRAVRASLVLLKNDGALLPLPRHARLLVVGAGAHSLARQSGGWSLTWQGQGVDNADFPAGDTVLDGLRQALGAARVSYSADAQGLPIDPARYDAIVAVLGETPYAEGNGDIPPSGTLRHSSRHPEDLALLQRVAGHGVPVVTVLLSGRPLHTNDLLNRSQAFVAAWLPGTEGGGIADVLLRDAEGRIAHDFVGRLPFSWPRSACQTPLNAGDGQQPLFALGYGLRYAEPAAPLGTLDESFPPGGCAAPSAMEIFGQAAVAPYTLHLASPGARWPDAALSDDPLATLERPEVSARTVQLHTQHDARLLRWRGPARLFAWAPQPAALDAYPDAALQFEVQVAGPPQGRLRLGLRCGERCAGEVDATRLFAALAPGRPHTLKIPLACLAARGADLTRVDQPFSLRSDAGFAAAFTRIRVVAGAARDADAVRCDDLPTPATP